MVGITALRWAYANGIIPVDPTLRLPEYSSKGKKRGVLSPEEAERLFRLDWKDARYRLVNIVAMITGLRSAEILALKQENVGDKYLFVEHSFSSEESLKGTKTDEERTVPIIPEIRDALRTLGDTNPHGDGYIFYSTKPGKPIDQKEPLKALKNMLIRLYIGDKWIEYDKGDSPEELMRKKEVMGPMIKEAKEYWKKRNVVFHSWRHFYSARMADKLDSRKVMLATGHKTEAVFQAYADHALEESLNEVAATANEIFRPIIPSQSKFIPDNKASRFDRKILYNEIWTEPVTVVAGRYGMSNNGLKKVCIRLAIPYPPRGYWAKVKAGKVQEKPELPEAEERAG
jgi:integrase